MALRGLRGTRRGRDLTAAAFGRLTAVAPLPDGKWRVRCLCGQVEVVKGTDLESGERTGCRRCGPLVGDWYGTPVWARWDRARKARKLSPAWEFSFRRFLDCVGSPPCPDAILMRPDPTRPLGPTNWRWSTREETVKAKTLRFRLGDREVGATELAVACGVSVGSVQAYVRHHPEKNGDGDAVLMYYREQAAKREAKERLRRIIGGKRTAK